VNGWCKLIDNINGVMTIGYSLEENKDCDGRILFNPDTKEMQISKLANGASEILTKHFICPLRSKIRKGLTLNKLYYVAVG